jgi:hypothetical protein
MRSHRAHSGPNLSSEKPVTAGLRPRQQCSASLVNTPDNALSGT